MSAVQKKLDEVCFQFSKYPKIDATLMSYVLDAPRLYVKSSTLSPLVRDYISQHKETIFGPTKVVLMGVDLKVASEINAALK